MLLDFKIELIQLNKHLKFITDGLTLQLQTQIAVRGVVLILLTDVLAGRS